MRSEHPERLGTPTRHPNDGWTLAEPLQVGNATRKLLHTLVDAVIADEPRTNTTIEDVARHVLVSLQYMLRSTQIGFLVGVHLLNWSPLWRFRGLRPLTRRSTDDVRHLLGEVGQSRWLPARLLMLAPQGLIMSTYFDQPYVHEAIDYAPESFVRSRIDLRKAWLAGQEPDVSTAEIRHRAKQAP